MMLILQLGSNIEDRQGYLNHAKQMLDEEFQSPVLVSSIFTSQSWGFSDPSDFLNQVLVYNTIEDPECILLRTQSIEHELGRVRKTCRYSSRTIDIDILFLGNKVLNTNTLIIPHPRLHLRRFSLVPLVEVLPDFIHPVFNKELKELLKECSDTLEVNLFIPPK